LGGSHELGEGKVILMLRQFFTPASDRFKNLTSPLRFISSLLLIAVTLVANSPQQSFAATQLANCTSSVGTPGATVNVATSGNDCIISFLSGTNTWTSPSNVSSIQLLLVGGGGGGGGGSEASNDGARGGGGGGAGGNLIYFSSTTITPSTTGNITIGTGGAGGGANNSSGGYGTAGGNGNTTSLTLGSFSATATGGIGGGVQTGSTVSTSGGNGGGNTYYEINGVWNNNAYGLTTWEGAGGGSGAGNVNGAGINGTDIGGPGGNGGNGGAGYSVSITGTSFPYSGGGGGGGTAAGPGSSPAGYYGTAGAGGSGIGGNGATDGCGSVQSCGGWVSPYNGGNGATNTGSGGGGGSGWSSASYYATNGGAGAAGILIIRYTMSTQTVSFSSSNPGTSAVGTTYQAAGSATSSLAVTLTIDSANTSYCSINGSNLVTFTAVGSCVVDINQGGNAGYLAATQVQQTMTVIAGSSGITLSISGSPLQYQHSGVAVITAHLTGADGTVTFFYNNKKIFRCVNVASSSLVATCNWKPAAHGTVWLSASYAPGGSNYNPSNSTPIQVFVTSRTLTRG
jgi:hypothetical protein